MEFIFGLVIGAAFSPFWMKVWTFLKVLVEEFLAKKSKGEDAK